MTQFYELHGTSIFTTIAISDFQERRLHRANANADVNVTRWALEHLGVREYRPDIGNKRYITQDEGIRHMTQLAESQDLARLVSYQW